MNLPLPFLVGLALLLVHEHFDESFPGEASWSRLLPLSVLTALPVLLALRTNRLLRAAVMRGSVPSRALRTAIRMQTWSIPAVFALIVLVGGLPELASDMFPDAHLGQLAILLTPLVAMEVALRVAERPAARWLDLAGLPSLCAVGPARLPITLLLLTPIAEFALAADLLFYDRTLEVFFSATALGSTVGLILVVLLMSLTLPLFFRWFLPTSATLPHSVARDVHDTAGALGFPKRQVIAMSTGYRVANAAMVGPLPWPRYLVLTDGIMSLLDASSLRSVVAHEIGHARAGHPALLLAVFAGMPLLLMQPLTLLDIDAGSLTLSIGGGVIIAAAAAMGLRAIAHRFEHEADLLAAEAMGGAGPCIDALRRVSELFPQDARKSTFRHPSEEQRILTLLAWERDPSFRAAFRRSGRRLRTVLGVILLSSLALAVWAHVRLWPLDQAVYRFYSGEFAAAEAALARVEPSRVGLEATEIGELRAEIAAARELFPDGGRWDQIRDRLASAAWQRGVRTLRDDGPRAARPWFALALTRAHPSAVERCAYLYCDAVCDEDHERAVRLRDHVLALGPSEELGRALLAEH